MSTSIGIRELKARLSECVRRATEGERIIVTDRGRPVAQLAALDDIAHIERGIAEGWITPAENRSRLQPARPLPAASGLSIAEVLDEDRNG